MYNNQVYDKSAVALSADGNGTAFSFKGGLLVMGAFGTFGGGSAKVQWSPDDPTGATWTDLGPQNGVATALTTAGTVAVNLPPGRYRFALAGSTAPSLTYWIGEANQGG